MVVSTTLLVRKPRYIVYVQGTRLPYVIEVTTTRGLDQDVASADITIPYPKPSYVKTWVRVSILMAATAPNDSLPFSGLVERFNGYFVSEQRSLWPGAIILHCEDILSLAKWTFTPDDVDLKGDTDTQAIKRILGPGDPDNNAGGVGIASSLMDIQGVDKLLTDFEDAPLFWEVGETALEAVQKLDTAGVGYRTIATAAGRILRRFLDTDPNTSNALWTFLEGTDIIEGSSSTEIKSPVNEITVTGWSDEWRATLPPDEDPFNWRFNSYWIRFMWLRTQTPANIDPQEIAAYILSQLSKNIIKVTFTTYIDLLFQGMEIIHVNSPHLNVNQHFWVQSVQTSITSEGVFAQTITGVSELVRDVQGPVIAPPTENPNPPGTDIVLPLPGIPVVPAAADILVDFVIVGIERELATPASVAGNQGFVYTVTFSDQSTSRQGLIVSWAWTAGGVGVTVTVPTGTERTFTTSFQPLVGATVTLTVTDSNGQTGSLTRQADSGEVPVHTRKLYACTDTTYEAFDGTQWRSATPSLGGTVHVVAGGPWWGAGNIVAYSADDLVSPPVEVVAFPSGEQISAIWKHESVEGDLAIGGASGSVSISHDKGLTWIPVTSPGSAVNFIIMSIHDPKEIHVVTPEGWLKSQNSGSSWSMVRAGSFTYLELSHTRNIVVTAAGVLQKGEDGTPFTGNTSPIVAATAHIRQDKFYALAADGTTWIQTTEGSYTLVPGEPIPAGLPTHAGTYRDGLMVDLVYFAAQSGGLFKTLDGFKTAAGYLRLRADGEITP